MEYIYYVNVGTRTIYGALKNYSVIHFITKWSKT